MTAGEVTLIVVTKTFPAEDVRLLAGLGVRHVGGEPRPGGGPQGSGLRGPAAEWHFVGQLQTNKARSVVRYADHVHSVDRRPAGRRAVAGGRRGRTP